MHHTPGILLNSLGVKPKLNITGGSNNLNTFIRVVLKRNREVKIYKAYCFQHQDEVRAIENNNSYFKDNEIDDWDRIRLLKRQMEIAVTEENYGLAIKMRELIKDKTQNLTITQQHILACLDQLNSEELSERRNALRQLGDVGNESIISDIARKLKEEELHKLAENAMMEIFSRSTKPEINKLMKDGMNTISFKRDLVKGLKIFEEIIRLEPNFAEGFNKRATVYYLMHRYQESIEDCQTVIRLQPFHFGAYSGMGLCYYCLRNYKAAINAFDRAIEINPGLTHIMTLSNRLKRGDFPEYL